MLGETTMDNSNWKKTGEFHGEVYTRQQKASNGGAPLILILVVVFLAIFASSKNKHGIKESGEQTPFSKLTPQKDAEKREKERNKAYAKDYYGYAKTQAQKGRYGRAIGQIENAISCDPDNLKYRAYKSYLEMKSNAEEAKVRRKEEAERRDRNNRIMKRLGRNARRAITRR
jgi:tetratricopeptide (TPR) repeat protein